MTEFSPLWKALAQKWKLSSLELSKMYTFWQMVTTANDLFNITAITQEKAFIAYHLEDSLMVSHLYNPWSIRTCVDVGSGGGFPGIPLAIKYPETNFILIEVTTKRIKFLQEVAIALELPNVTVVTLDWRTFLRKTEHEVDLFCARASLAPAELIRLFRPSCSYNAARLVYWAARDYQPTSAEVPLIERTYAYSVGNKDRILVEYVRKNL